MDTNTVFSILHESLFVILIFGVALVYALARGRQAIINVILGLYFALLITREFPYFDVLLAQTDSVRNESLLMIGVFAVVTVLATILFTRLMPRDYDESTFQGFGRKFLFAIGATALVMTFSYHTLPVTEFVDPGSPIQSLFAPEQSFFVWLIIPLVMLFVL